MNTSRLAQLAATLFAFHFPALAGATVIEHSVDIERLLESNGGSSFYAGTLDISGALARAAASVPLGIDGGELSIVGKAKKTDKETAGKKKAKTSRHDDAPELEVVIGSDTRLYIPRATARANGDQDDDEREDERAWSRRLEFTTMLTGAALDDLAADGKLDFSIARLPGEFKLENITFRIETSAVPTAPVTQQAARVPVPSSSMLLAVGLIAAGLGGRQKRTEGTQKCDALHTPETRHWQAVCARSTTPPRARNAAGPARRRALDLAGRGFKGEDE